MSIPRRRAAATLNQTLVASGASTMKIALKDWNAWVDREEARRRLEDNPPPNTGLLPAAELSDEYAPDDGTAEEGRGRRSSAVRSLLAGACAGWKHPPDSAEFYDAMRAGEPTRRQKTIAAVLIAEGTANDILLAYLQGAFTWRQLGMMMHRRGLYSGHLARYVNRHRVPR